MSQAAIWLRGAEWKAAWIGRAERRALRRAVEHGARTTSADGKVVVGLAWNGCNFARAFRWEESTGMVDLGSTVAGRSSRANGVSGDGRVVVGWQEHATDRGWARDGSTAGRRSSRAPTEFVGEAYGATTEWLDHRRTGLCRCGDPLRSERVDVDRRRAAWSACRRRASGCRSFYIGAAFAVSDDGRVIAGYAKLRPRERGGDLDRSHPALLEGLPARERRAQCL